MTKNRGWLVPFCTALIAHACAGSIIGPGYQTNGCRFDFRNPGCDTIASVPAAPSGSVEIRQLGSGGILVGWGDDAILIGPYFSRAGSVFAALTGCLWFDSRRIHDGMAAFDSGRVRAILLGHSHFDHIGDIPVIAREWVKSGPIYTNDSGLNLLHPYCDVADRAQSVEHDTAWIEVPGSSFRILPVRSMHAPQVCRGNRWPCTYAKCETWKPLDREWDQHVPLRKFCGGQTMGYLIELRDDKQGLRFRIYYTDAALSDGVGAPPDDMMSGDTKIDVAIMCMASYDLVDGYPKWLVERLHPRHVIVTHFEDFFTNGPQQSWRFVQRLTNRKAEVFIKELDEATSGTEDPLQPSNAVCGPSTKRWSMPVPDPHRALYFNVREEAVK